MTLLTFRFVLSDGKVVRVFDEVGREINLNSAESYHNPLLEPDQQMALARQIGSSLEAAGLWLSPSVPLQFWGAVVRLQLGGNLSADTLQNLYLAAFRYDDCSCLRTIVTGWFTDEKFQNWKRHIEDSLDAHVSGKFTLSIPAVTIVIEGVIRDLIGKQKLRYFPKQIRQLLDDGILSEVTAQPFATAIDRFVKSIGEETELSIQHRTDFYRHLIIHARNPDYDTELNSLRGFLLLDQLHYLSPVT